MGREGAMLRWCKMTAYLAVVLMLLSIHRLEAAELRDKVIGTWKLISIETLRPGGQVSDVWMGPHPTGLIIYLPNGYMSVQIMRDPRPTFKESRLTGTSDEVRKAYYAYYSYWGTYTVDEKEGTIEHKLQGSLFPEEVGRTRKRTVQLDGIKLVLATPPFKAGQFFTKDQLDGVHISSIEDVLNRLTWERVE